MIGLALGGLLLTCVAVSMTSVAWLIVDAAKSTVGSSVGVSQSQPRQTQDPLLELPAGRTVIAIGITPNRRMLRGLTTCWPMNDAVEAWFRFRL